MSYQDQDKASEGAAIAEDHSSDEGVAPLPISSEQAEAETDAFVGICSGWDFNLTRTWGHCAEEGNITPTLEEMLQERQEREREAEKDRLRKRIRDRVSEILSVYVDTTPAASPTVLRTCETLVMAAE